MYKIRSLILLIATVTIPFVGCRDEVQFDKYERPEWLAGKLYTQMLEQPDLSTFARCVELVGYNEIIDVSGSYTVFAPSNDAFTAYFQSNPSYNSVDDIPLSELERIVKYHIVQNPWSKQQLRSLDIYGWIDTLSLYNNQPRGFKRETLLKGENLKYGIISKNSEEGTVTITDTLQSTWYRRVATDSRKYVPIFYSEYFNISELSSNDYQFYFDRSFDGGDNIYFANGKIVSDEIFAENGFIYIIDEVVTPLRNAYQIIGDNDGTSTYSRFFNLLNNYPNFEYNEEKTNDQPGVDQGLEVDSLFDLTFPDLAFNITNEKTGPPKGVSGLAENVTIRYHHGMMAPNDQALESFINEYLNIPGGWGGLSKTPLHIKKIIANTHLSYDPVYPSYFKREIYNGAEDVIELDESDISHTEFGSNSTFIGLNKAIVPRAFSSVTGPVYLQKGYSKVMYAIEETGLLPALKRKNKNYMFFIESDNNTAQDSSLMYNGSNFYLYLVVRNEGGGEEGEGEPQDLSEKKDLTVNDLRVLLFNHIALDHPKGIARKEFIPNLAGSYLVVNNETGEVKGTAETTVGYYGEDLAPEYPAVLSVADNGTTYDIKNWFSFSASTIYSSILVNYPTFHSLLVKAGLAKEKESRYTFISNSESYTVFIPSDEAIQEAGLFSLSVSELKRTLLLHFIQGDMIFTDGNKESAYYETARIDEKSTPYSTVYSQIYIEPDVDVIRIVGKDNSVFTEINESENTNRLVGNQQGVSGDTYRNVINNGVIHAIDKVLKFSDLETK